MRSYKRSHDIRERGCASGSTENADGAPHPPRRNIRSCHSGRAAGLPPGKREPESSNQRNCPLIEGGHTVGVLTFERSSGALFDPDTIELCKTIGGLLGPILGAQARARAWVNATCLRKSPKRRRNPVRTPVRRGEIDCVGTGGNCGLLLLCDGNVSGHGQDRGRRRGAAGRSGAVRRLHSAELRASRATPFEPARYCAASTTGSSSSSRPDCCRSASSSCASIGRRWRRRSAPT